MKRYSLAALLGLALSSSLIVAVLAQQDARPLRRLFITGSFVPAFNAERTELTLAAGEGPIGGVVIRPPEGGSLSVTREPILGDEKRRLIVTLAAGAPGPESPREAPPSSGPSEPPPSPRLSPTASAPPLPTPTPSPGSSPSPPTSPDAPPTHQVGGGWLSKGGDGRPKGLDGDVYHVTTLADSGAGSLRNGIVNRSKPRTIVFDVAGEIVVKREMPIEIPYLTIDGFSAPAPGITLVQGKCDARVIGGKSTHDIEIRGLRIKGCWEPGMIEKNWETLIMDGDSSPEVVPWDDEPPLEQNRDWYVWSNTFIDAMNDIGSVWCGAKGITIANNLVVGNYHPHTTGCKGWRARDHIEARLDVSIIGNVYWDNGERQPIIREGCYGCDVVNNVVGSWQNYAGIEIGGSDGGYGIGVRDPPNYDLNVVGNALLLGTEHWIRDEQGVRRVPGTWRPAWDCVWGADPGSPTGDPRMEGQHYSDNIFSPTHNPKHCVSTKNGKTMFKRSYPLPILSSAALEPIIAGAGMPYPDARELAVKAAVQAAYLKRVRQ